MSNTELAELFLTVVFDEAEKNGHGTRISLDEIASKFGVNDKMRVYNIAKYLHDRNLIEADFTVGETWAMITGGGAIFVEQGGSTGIIGKYRANPNSYITIDNSTKIYGNVSNSNIATHSPHATQTASTKNPDIEKLILLITETIKKDSTLSTERIVDAIQDIESLKLQLSKKNKSLALINSILTNLSDISSIASFILQLTPLILH